MFVIVVCVWSVPGVRWCGGTGRGVSRCRRSWDLRPPSGRGAGLSFGRVGVSFGNSLRLERGSSWSRQRSARASCRRCLADRGSSGLGGVMKASSRVSSPSPAMSVSQPSTRRIPPIDFDNDGPRRSISVSRSTSPGHRPTAASIRQVYRCQPWRDLRLCRPAGLRLPDSRRAHPRRRRTVGRVWSVRADRRPRPRGPSEPCRMRWHAPPPVWAWPPDILPRWVNMAVGLGYPISLCPPRSAIDLTHLATTTSMPAGHKSPRRSRRPALRSSSLRDRWTPVDREPNAARSPHSPLHATDPTSHL
jgi:hypothetical protein